MPDHPADQRSSSTESRLRSRSLFCAILGLEVLILPLVLSALFTFVLHLPSQWNWILIYLGILTSIVCSLLAIVAGIAEWSDRRTWSSRRASAIGIGIGSVVLAVLAFVFIVLSQTGEVPASTRDTMINDLNNIAAHAYQYKIRPASMGGGGKSYKGYVIPAKIARLDYAEYSAFVLHSDAIVFQGRSTENRENVLSVVLDADGRLMSSSWRFFGDFADDPPVFD